MTYSKGDRVKFLFDDNKSTVATADPRNNFTGTIINNPSGKKQDLHVEMAKDVTMWITPAMVLEHTGRSFANRADIEEASVSDVDNIHIDDILEEAERKRTEEQDKKNQEG